MHIELEQVYYIPKDLMPGVLYVSEEFEIALHLCPCGCGAKIRTPLGPTEWTLEKTEGGPTLLPSIGNWQQACQSHYWIRRGEVIWSTAWTPEEIADGRHEEEERRRAYYEALNHRHDRPIVRFWSWIKNLFRR